MAIHLNTYFQYNDNNKQDMMNYYKLQISLVRFCTAFNCSKTIFIKF